MNARKIALLYRFEQLTTKNIPDEVIDCLWSLCWHYSKPSGHLTAYKNRLLGTVDQLFWSFTDVFKDIVSVTALAILKKYPSLEVILKADRDELLSLIRQTLRKTIQWATGKHELLISKAVDFNSLIVNSIANFVMLKDSFSMIRTPMEALKNAFDAVNKLLEQDSKKNMPMVALAIDILCSITEISLLTAANIVAEVSDFSAFSKSDKMVGYFGVPPVKQSDQFEGTKNKMSKHGSRLIRMVLNTTALANFRKKLNGKEHKSNSMQLLPKKCLSKPKKSCFRRSDK